MKRNLVFWIAILVLGLAQAACNLPTRAASPTPDLFATLAATAGVSDSTASPQASATGQPAITATTEPTQAAAATSTPVNTVAPVNQVNNDAQNPVCKYQATFLEDVTVPDDTYMDPGEAFTKVWRVRNDSTCTWGAGYALNSLLFYSGSRFGAPSSLPISGSVGPGQVLDITVNMVAPSTPGVYTSAWMFGLNDGYLGLGPSRSGVLYTRIVVGATPTSTPRPINAERIYFPSGATAVGIDGNVAAGGKRNYILTAMKNQLLIASISSPVQDLTLRIVDAGTMDVLASVKGPSVQAMLPRDGDYLIQVISNSDGADFTLGVTIPARITFAPGAVSASVDGKIVNRYATSYLLRAMEDQEMTVTIDTDSSSLALTIYGLSDGQPLVRSHQGLTSWTGILPATQDYVIMVVPAVDSATYTLTATVVW